LAPHRYYAQCSKGIGRPVRIQTRDGRVHRGIISKVSNSHVYVRPLPSKRLGGFGYGYGGGFGGYGGYGYGSGWGIALAAIAALAFLPFFFW
jgi:hypothetical protein